MNAQQTFSNAANQIESSFIRDILKATQLPGMLSFAGGLPDPKLFPTEQLREAYKQATQEFGDQFYQYGETAGVSELRQWIAENLCEGGSPELENLMITSGTQQGIDLIARSLINPGDKILVESPTYLGALQVFKAAGAELIEIKSDADGPCPDHLKFLLSKHQFKLCYLMPNFQNPTGLTYPLNRRKQLTDLLMHQCNCLIIEDDPYGQLRYQGEHLPSLRSFLPDQVLRLVSFSKVVAPSLRLGFILGPKDILATMNKIKQVSDLHTSCCNQYQLLSYLKSGHLSKHLEEIKSSYNLRMNHMTKGLTEKLKTHLQFQTPQGGMFIWGKIKDGQSCMNLVKAGLSKQIAFVPGDAFFAVKPQEQFIRLNFTNGNCEMIDTGIQRMTELFDSVT